MVTLQKKRQMKERNILVIALVLVILSTITRLIPHPFNFTPVVAILLFSTYAFKGNYKFIVPIAAIVISDLFIELQHGYGFHSGTWLVYGAYIAIWALASFMLKHNNLVRNMATAALGSILFFLVTNFAFFYPEAPLGSVIGYPHNLQGVIASYTAGIPFFRNMFIGDIIFSVSLFAIYDFSKKLVYKVSI